MNVTKLLALLPIALVTACANNSYCMGEQKYQVAGSVPPLYPVEGMKLPESPSALRIPPPPPNPVPYGQVAKNADGDDKIQCLDKPPDMPPVAVKPEDIKKPGEAKPIEEKPAEPKPAG